MKKLQILIFLLIPFYIFSHVEIQNTLFGFKYQNNDFLDYGYYYDTSINYVKPNNEFKILVSYNKIQPKNYFYQNKIIHHEVRTDSVYYSDVWINGIHYDTFVYDTTFVDTTFTIIDTFKVTPEKISQMEMLIDWTYRQELWYYWGFGGKLTIFNDSQQAFCGIFHQNFYKKIGNITFSYKNSIIGTLFDLKKEKLIKVTKTTNNIYNTTEDSLYLFEPDSVHTFVHTEDTYNIQKTQWNHLKLLQLSNTLSLDYRNFCFSMSYNFLKRSDKFGNYFKMNISYHSYTQSYEIIGFKGNPYLMHDFDYKYFNPIKEKLLYGIYGIAKFYPLNKKWITKFGISYSKFEDFVIKGLFVGLSINLK